jgi:hypothetical protein
VVGSRPEIIQAAPLSAALREVVDEVMPGRAARRRGA